MSKNLRTILEEAQLHGIVLTERGVFSGNSDNSDTDDPFKLES